MTPPPRTQPRVAHRPEATTVVGVRDLVAGYGRRRVLDGVSFDVAAGSLVGVEGENGSGKSTLLRCLVGLHRPSAGEIAVHGRVGYCPQEPTLVDSLTLAEHVDLFGAGYGLPPAVARGRADELMALFGCDSFAGSRVDQVSGGTRQKINLIVAVLDDPSVLVLDEPYQGFDYDTYLKFWDFAERARGAGGSVLVVSHMITERHRFDRVLTLRDGRVETTTADHREGRS